MPALTAAGAFWALDLALRGTLILVLACLIVALLARASAALRHVVWTSAVAALLALPLLVFALPAWRALPRWEKTRLATPAAPALPPAPASAFPVTPEALAIPAVTDPALDIAPAGGPPVRATPITSPAKVATALAWPNWLLAAWLAGTVVLLVPLVVAALALRRLRRVAAPCTLSLAQQLLAECRREFAIRRHVCLLVAPGAAPMTFGMLRPHILLPADSAAWSPDRWRIVLRHELAHIQRHDLLTQTFAQLMRAGYWFHPLAWFACARMAAERERACDDLTLAGTEPAAYAAELFAVARAARPSTLAQRLATAAVVPMARFSSLEARVRAILDVHRNRRRLTGTLLLAALLSGLAFLLPIATLRAAAPRPATAPVPTDATLPAATFKDPSPAIDPLNQPTVAVLGKVRGTGIYNLLPGAGTVGGMLAMAGLPDPDMNQKITLYRKNPEGTVVEVWSMALRQVLGVSLQDKDLLVVGQVDAPASTTQPAASGTKPAVDPALIAIQEAEVEIAKHRADNTSEIDAEKAVLAQSKVNLARMEASHAPPLELDKAHLEVTIDEARIAIATTNHEKEILTYKLALARLQAVKNGISPSAINPATGEPAYTGQSAAEDEAALALAKHRADDTVEIDAEKAMVAQSQIKIERVKNLHDQGLITEGEMNQATAELAQNRAQLARAVSQHEEEILKYKLLQQQIKAATPQPASSQPK